MEIVCDCANARVAGKGHLGTKILDGSDPVEQAEKIAQVKRCTQCYVVTVILVGWVDISVRSHHSGQRPRQSGCPYTLD